MYFIKVNSDGFVIQVAQNVLNTQKYTEVTQSQFNEYLQYFISGYNVLKVNDNYDIIISETETQIAKYNRLVTIEGELQQNFSTYKGQNFDYWLTIFNSKRNVNSPFEQEYKKMYQEKLELVLELESLKEELDYVGL